MRDEQLIALLLQDTFKHDAVIGGNSIRRDGVLSRCNPRRENNMQVQATMVAMRMNSLGIPYFTCDMSNEYPNDVA
eukprot:6035313-Amphidinium_carterae.1